MFCVSERESTLKIPYPISLICAVPLLTNFKSSLHCYSSTGLENFLLYLYENVSKYRILVK